jgi:hypothetical protein
MGIMKTAAVKGIIPAGNKVSELRSNLGRLMTETAIVMEERFGKDGLDAVAEVFQETDHPYCPQHEGFIKKGKLFCESVCWPYVSAVAEGIAPGVKMEVPKPATMDATCTKALVYSLDESK